MAYYFLFDNKRRDKDFILEQLGKPVEVIYSSESKKKIFGWINGVINVITKSNRHDTIICWFDFQAVLCWWICKLMFLDRHFVCINIMLKDKPTLKNKVVSYLYKKALADKSFNASVTSVRYGQWLNRKLGINVKYTLIHDVYHDFYEFGQTVEQIPNSVFCGGNNGRDWNFIIKVAKKMPNVRFNMVMPHYVYLKYKNDFTENINVKYDIPYNEFMKEMCSSSIVCLPLDTEAPAGLIVMFQAAANKKMVITTDTVTTHEYISTEYGAILKNDENLWVNEVNYSIKNPELTLKKASAFKQYLLQNCSEKLFIKGLKSIL